MGQGQSHFSDRNVSENCILPAQAVEVSREDWLRRVQRNGLTLRLVPEELKDKKMVMEAVQQNGMALQAAPGALKEDKEIVTAAARSNWRAFGFAGEAMTEDPEMKATWICSERLQACL